MKNADGKMQCFYCTVFPVVALGVFFSNEMVIKYTY